MRDGWSFTIANVKLIRAMISISLCEVRKVGEVEFLMQWPKKRW